MAAKVFFSSCFNDPDGQRLTIRDRVLREFNPQHFARSDPRQVAELPVWMAENHPELDEDAVTTPLEKAMFCVEGVRQSAAYVAVVKSRHGSGVEISAESRAQASYFELELFEAALLRKPAYVFLLRGAEPGPRLKSLLDLLAPALPGFEPIPLDEDEVLRRTTRILHWQSRQHYFSLLGRAAASAKRMADSLTGTRHRAYDPLRELPNLQFLAGTTDAEAATPTRALVEELLHRAGQAMDHQTKLTLLWMAIRELMGAPANDPMFRSFLPLWDAALSGWASAGAWYGLHGHPLMDCLASLSSLARIRQQTEGVLEQPHGLLSSEYYSIAKQVGTAQLRREMLRMSHKHISAAFVKGRSSGNYALRGSILNAMGDRDSAISDYETALALREHAEAATPAQIGDSKSELGFALVMAGRRRQGIDLMEAGMALLDSCEPSGFLVRAKRKLGRAYLMAGSPRMALATLAQAHELAVRFSMGDQLGPLERAAWRVKRLLRRP